jgi:hypothetical protein
LFLARSGCEPAVDTGAGRAENRGLALHERTGAWLAAALCAVVAALFPAVATAGPPTIERHPAAGGEAYFGTCPDTEELPPAGTVCIDNYVLVWRGYAVVGGGGVPRSTGPWHVLAETVRLEFTGAPEPIVTVLRFGFGELDGEASVDTVHLSLASAAFTLSMSDGSTFDFAGTWTALGERLVFGNDGPATGAPRHFVDRCRTFNANGHQKFRPASMTGTLNGEPIHSYTSSGPFAATIFNNRFLYIDVPHGGCV